MGIFVLFDRSDALAMSGNKLIMRSIVLQVLIQSAVSEVIGEHPILPIIFAIKMKKFTASENLPLGAKYTEWICKSDPFRTSKKVFRGRNGQGQTVEEMDFLEQKVERASSPKSLEEMLNQGSERFSTFKVKIDEI